jgi:hypothetical protein
MLNANVSSHSLSAKMMGYALCMTEGFFLPQQQRSGETLARLITATLVTLEEHGLEGATISRIASVAKIAPASVYIDGFVTGMPFIE